jgi:RNA polymerase sigma-70 factor (ECF subfamily)
VTAAHLPRSRRSESSDEDWLPHIAAGDLSCLGLMFDRHAIELGRFIARLGVDDGDVDDLVQATFLLVPRAAPGFRGGAVRAWLFGLAVNLVRRHRRSLARMASRIAAWAMERGTDAPETPGQALEARESADRAKRFLARLSPKKREVFVMVAMEGLGPEETAAALGIPIGTVWTRLHHARRELRAHLQRGRD